MERRKIYPRVQGRGSSDDPGPRGLGGASVGGHLAVHPNVLRKWAREMSVDPAQAFPGHGQMKPEQLEIERLKREVAEAQGGA